MSLIYTPKHGVNVKIIPKDDGTHFLLIDGHDVSSKVSGIVLTLRVDNIPRVELSLLGKAIDVDEKGCDLAVWVGGQEYQMVPVPVEAVKVPAEKEEGKA